MDFLLKKWYVSRIGLPWTSAQEAVAEPVDGEAVLRTVVLA